MAAPAPWMPNHGGGSLLVPYFGAKYLGYDSNRITFENLQRLDYFHGYIYARRDPETINLFTKYIPFGVFSFEAYGVIGSNKEWLSRPSLEAFVAQIGISAGSAIGGVGLLAPTRVWEEECFHASQEILHPRFTEYSQDFMSVITLQKIPVVRSVLSSVFYFFHPMEIDAKIKKWVYAGFVFNLDCDAAWYRYNSLLTLIAVRRCEIEGVRYRPWHVALAYEGLINNRAVESNPIFDKALHYRGIIVRVPYETKMVYAPWVHGVMRENKELPLFTRWFIAPVFGEVGYK